jgi:hypothetical protein
VLDEQLAIWAVDQITAERRWGNVALFQLMRYATGGRRKGMRVVLVPRSDAPHQVRRRCPERGGAGAARPATLVVQSASC